MPASLRAHLSRSGVRVPNKLLNRTRKKSIGSDSIDFSNFVGIATACFTSASNDVCCSTVSIG